MKCLIIDALSILFRAYYSIPNTMSLKDGTTINAVYGFTNLIFKAIEIFKPEMVLVCFDSKGPTFRKEIS